MRRQDSNSGEKLGPPSGRTASLPSMGPSGVSTVCGRRSSLWRQACQRRMPSVPVSRKMIFSSLGDEFGRGEDGEQHAGAVFLHLDARRINVECAGFEELGRGVADDFAADVVEVGFQHPDLIAGHCVARLADDQPQDVGLLLQIAVARAEADGFHRHRRAAGRIRRRRF